MDLYSQSPGIYFHKRKSRHAQILFNKGLRGGLAVACWTAKREVRGSNSGQGRNVDLDVCFMRTPNPPQGPQVSGYQSQSKAWNSPIVRKIGSNEWVHILRS